MKEKRRESNAREHRSDHVGESSSPLSVFIGVHLGFHLSSALLLLSIRVYLCSSVAAFFLFSPC
jgi:hypothetical protein